MHIWPVHLAAEPLIRRHTHAEVSNLDIEKLQQCKNERQTYQKHYSHSTMEHDSVIQPP